MMSDFLVAFRQFEVWYLFEKVQNTFWTTIHLTKTEPEGIIAYIKINEEYLNAPQLWNQVVKKTISITEALY